MMKPMALDLACGESSTNMNRYYYSDISGLPKQKLPLKISLYKRLSTVNLTVLSCMDIFGLYMMNCFISRIFIL